MRKLAICNELWRDRNLEAVFATAASIGFAGVEIAPFTLAETVRDITPDRRREIVKAAGDAGVEIVGLHWLFCSPPGLHLTTPDPAVRKRTADYLNELVDFCGDLGGRVMILGSPKQRSVEPPNTMDEAYKRAVEGLAACVERCRNRDVTVCFEALAPAETNFINTAEEAARLADEVGDPHVDIMLDVKAMSSMPEGIVPTIRRFGGRARHLHVNESSGKGPGMPHHAGEPAPVDFKAALAALAETPFGGWISAEPFDDTPDPDTVAQTAFETINRAG